VTTDLTDDGLQFVADRHLAMLSTIARDGAIHQIAVGFTLDAGVVRIITSGDTQKVRNIERDDRATVGQVDGARWISFVGNAVIEREPADVTVAENLYARRYRQPQPNPKRVVIRIDVDRVLASRGLRSDRG
jgi:PPOX class probable F420-dependent enzyme